MRRRANNAHNVTTPLNNDYTMNALGRPVLPYNCFYTPNGVVNGLWATDRPRTGHWGSGQVLDRLIALGDILHWSTPDIIFGKQDQVTGFTIDNDPAVRPSVVADWAALPFADAAFTYGFWDPPYLSTTDKNAMIHYNLLLPCLREICRVVASRIAILHPMIYACPDGWRRSAVIAVTMGPMKVTRALQIFHRQDAIVPMSSTQHTATLF